VADHTYDLKSTWKKGANLLLTGMYSLSHQNWREPLPIHIALKTNAYGSDWFHQTLQFTMDVPYPLRQEKGWAVTTLMIHVSIEANPTSAEGCFI